jgi:CRP-like cAMP-binding protein
MKKSISESRYRTSNRLLLRLSADDLALLSPHLKRVSLPLNRQLEAAHKPIEQVYFIEDGFASVVTDRTARNKIEVGLIGSEGMTGLAIALGSDRGPHDTFMQNAGGASRIASARLRQVMARSRSLHKCLMLYAYAFVVQATHTAMANARSTLEERLARWLLMALDRNNTKDLVITHEALSIKLGVRRPGVTGALSLLEKIGLIRTGRGIITIIDRRGLKRACNGAYGMPEAEYERLLS